jgi:hypothetical protein
VTNNEDIAAERALSARWAPKTAASGGSIPFNFETRVEVEVEHFFHTYAEHPLPSERIDRQVN